MEERRARWRVLLAFVLYIWGVVWLVMALRPAAWGPDGATRWVILGMGAAALLLGLWAPWLRRRPREDGKQERKSHPPG